MIGQTLGRYRIDAQLGSGGMGVVYRAHDTELRRPVAIKVLSNTGSARERLLREARAASALNHPNVCTVHEVGQSSEGQSFIVMEYVEGRSLDALIPVEGLPTEAVVNYGVQIASALADSHAHGIVHRDLKSANVRITADGRVKVLDFGLASHLPSAESGFVTESRVAGPEAERLAGTLPYMAPEILQGEPADERSDIWAFGVLLYEAATGARPFRGQTPFDLTSAILRDPAMPLPTRVPAGLRAIIDRCLAKRPGERYQHASEVRAALEVCRGDAPPRAVTPLQPNERRRSVVLAAKVAIGAAVVAAVAFSLTQRSGQSVGARVSTGGPASPNPEANEYFELGALFLSKQFDLQRARAMLERALELDPHFAEARAHYGFTNLLMIDGGYSNDTVWLYKAETEVQRALQDDPTLGRGHWVRAAVYLYQGRKELMPASLDMALKANPADLDALVWRANYEQLNGENAAAQATLNGALKLDPLFFPARMVLGDLLREQGDTAGSIREHLKVLDQEPQMLYGITFLVRAYLDQGDTSNARATLERASANDRQNYLYRLAAALLASVDGRRTEALRDLDPEVLKYASLLPMTLTWAIDAFCALGETQRALDLLESGMRAGDDRADYYRRDRYLTALRSTPRFKQILESMDRRRAQRAAAR
jgi:Tfp pilus assembly protein PilF/predicted Ser/Thr protein kinase